MLILLCEMRQCKKKKKYTSALPNNETTIEELTITSELEIADTPLVCPVAESNLNGSIRKVVQNEKLR